MKGARCFETKKAVNHELEAHDYGGGEKENEEDDDGGWLASLRRRGGEDKRVEIFCRRSGGDNSTN